MNSTPDLNMVNAYIPGRVKLNAATAALIERRDALLGPAYRLMYEHPLHIVRGEGAWLIDPEGRRYLDAYNNVASLGHCHPAVTEAICRQVQTLATNTRYLHDTILELAERLLATVPETELAHLMLTCTGSEANDVAYRIAQVRTGGTGVIVTETAYHGFTDAVAKFSPSLGATVDLGAHVRLVPAPRAYHAGAVDVAERFTRDVEAAIRDLQRHGIKPAVLIVDSIFTSDGILPEPAGLLKGAVEAIKRAGGIFIADEVQPGFGRTGEHLWGFQRHGVIPDIVTLGKPMGNGQPVAGLLATADVLAEFGRNSRYFNTFGGNNVSCAAALAVLDTIEKERLVQHAAEVGTLLREGIAALAHRHAAIGDVRGGRHVRRRGARVRSADTRAGSSLDDPGGQSDARQGCPAQRLRHGPQRAEDSPPPGAHRGTGRPGDRDARRGADRSALCSSPRLALTVQGRPMQPPASLDAFDIKILVYLQREGRCSNVELSSAISLSESPCLLRTKRLQDTGVIRGYHADIALEKVGSHVIVFSEVTLSSHRPADFRTFEDGITRYQEIVECHNVSGGYDYLLKIVVPSINWLQALMDRLLEDNIGIEKFASRIVLRQPLSQGGYPLETLVNERPSWADEGR